MGNPTEFRQIIKKAECAIGGTKALAERAGVKLSQICDAKAGRAGLKDEACEVIAELAQEDFGDVIRARMRQRGFTELAMLVTLAGASLMTLFVTTFVTSGIGAAAGAGFSGLYDLAIHYATKAKKIMARILGTIGLANNSAGVLYRSLNFAGL